MMIPCRDCACFPVCEHECFFRSFNADGCQYFIAKQRAYAHWIIDGDGKWAECSNCHEMSKFNELEHKDFCGACGAIMNKKVMQDEK